jgi:CheY-like chemotaxis protein
VEGGRRGDTVYITVTDNGNGIPAHVLPFIFDPFFTTKNLGEGTGLGLSIAHTLIENHGGTISAKSEPGNTVFTIELPMARSPKPPAESRQTQPLPAPPSRRSKRLGRVLVVDDVTTDKANDGEEALKLLSGNRYDAIISDIRMPGIDGPALYEKAVAMDPSYSSRFLFMSGDLVRDSTQGFVSSLSCPCLAKPFALQVLYQNLEPHLNNGNDGGSPSGSLAPRAPSNGPSASGGLGKPVLPKTGPLGQSSSLLPKTTQLARLENPGS